MPYRHCPLFLCHFRQRIIFCKSYKLHFFYLFISCALTFRYANGCPDVYSIWAFRLYLGKGFVNVLYTWQATCVIAFGRIWSSWLEGPVTKDKNAKGKISY